MNQRRTQEFWLLAPTQLQTLACASLPILHGVLQDKQQRSHNCLGPSISPRASPAKGCASRRSNGLRKEAGPFRCLG